MEFNITKVVYNLFEESPNVEILSVDVIGKLGISKDDISNRAHFVEINIEGTNEETKDITRNLTVVARLDYQLDKNKIDGLGKSSTDEDRIYFEKCINRMAKYISKITAESNSVSPIHIDAEGIIDGYKEEKNNVK